ncbi:MAG: hypothetical protein ACE5F4_00065 [Candidatus Paceibacteria bacterium]
MLKGVLAILLVLSPVSALAVEIPVLETALTLRVIPANPAPGSTVTVRAENVSAAGGAMFVWRVNGAVVDQGVGVEAITAGVGNAGSATTVSVSVSGNGVSAEDSVTIRPASVDIVWEGDTYVPPWYLGRPLMNGSGTATFTAVPEIIQGGVRVPPANLVYSWYVNHSATPEHFGYGLRTITLTTPQFENPFTVSVVVETTDGAVRAENNVTVEPVRPVIAVYERAPLFGLRTERGVGDEVRLAEDEITFVAHPFFVNDLSGPDYAWSIDGNPVEETGRTVRELTLRREGEGGGRFYVAFALEHAQLLFERATQNFLLTF